MSQQPQKICIPVSRREATSVKLAKVFKKRWAHALLRLFRAGGSGACLQASVRENCLASAGVVPQPCNTEREKLHNTAANSGPQQRRQNAQNPTGLTGTELP